MTEADREPEESKPEEDGLGLNIALTSLALILQVLPVRR